MGLKQFTFSFLLLLLAIASRLCGQSTEILIVDDMQLIGKIADSVSVEFLLQGDGVHGFFQRGNDSCREFKGELYSKDNRNPKSIVGQVCFAAHSITLSAFEGDVLAERFIGKWDQNFAVTGTWRSKQSNTKLGFQLTMPGKPNHYIHSQSLYLLAIQELSGAPPFPVANRDIILDLHGNGNHEDITTNIAGRGKFTYLSPSRIELERVSQQGESTTRSRDIFQTWSSMDLAFHYSEASFSQNGSSNGAMCTNYLRRFQVQHLSWEDITEPVQAIQKTLSAYGKQCNLVVLGTKVHIGETVVDLGGH